MTPAAGTEHEIVRARQVAAELAADDVRVVALTWVDNAGITRVKAVPTNRLTTAVRDGVGMSPVFDVYLVDDSMTTSTHIGGPVGDLRLFPDLAGVVPLAAQSGWAWAPVSRRTQADTVYPGCQRSFAGRMAAEAERAGLEIRMAFEVEWFVGTPTDDGVEPACGGPAYGMTRAIELSDYVRDLLDALAAQRIAVDQFHPEYAPGQLELSIAPADPVTAADLTVSVRQTIRAISTRHGYRASFAPVVVAGGVGNGAHLHLSAHSEGVNPFAGGSGAVRAHPTR